MISPPQQRVAPSSAFSTKYSASCNKQMGHGGMEDLRHSAEYLSSVGQLQKANKPACAEEASRVTRSERTMGRIMVAKSDIMSIQSLTVGSNILTIELKGRESVLALSATIMKRARAPRDTDICNHLQLLLPSLC